jgi:hypothetical protein
MDPDLLYCDRCGARLAMRFRNALTGRLCWFGRDTQSVELTETPQTINWVCTCGFVTEITDSVPKEAAPKRCAVVAFDQSRRRKRQDDEN